MNRGKYLVSLALNNNNNKNVTVGQEFIYSSLEPSPNLNQEYNNELTDTNTVTHFTELVENDWENSDDAVKDKDYHYESDDSNTSSKTSDPDVATENPNVEDETDVSFNKGRPKKGRKRKFQQQDRNIRKRNCNSNKDYYSAKGTLIKKRDFIDFKCTCKNQCHMKISAEDRKLFFSTYWNLSDYNAQTTFLSTYVKETKIKRKRMMISEKRNFSRIYLLKTNVRVCREIFIKTLQISTKRINTALRKVRTLVLYDKRGISGGHNKMTGKQKYDVISHINKFPRYKSHYCRKNTEQQQFLPIGTTILMMYKLYKEENENIVSLSSYTKLFYTEFNLKTKSLKKDTCNKCDTYLVKQKNASSEEEKEQLTTVHNNHLLEAEEAREKMKSDLKAASENEEIETLTFDLEKTLPLPKLTTNIIYYKRQLCLYNCGIHGSKNDNTFCNLWLENQAGRGAQEVGSCLRKYIFNHVPNTIKHLNLWSDSCGGQNRNIKIVLILKCILEEKVSLESIQLKFLTPGHSFLPNDSDFGDIECAIKKQQKLFSPKDYENVIKDCRRKHPINVVCLKKEDFVSTKTLEKQITNRKKDVCKDKINWLCIKEIKLNRNDPYSIFIRTSHNNENTYSEINIKKLGRPSVHSNTIFSKYLEQLWPNGKPVAQAKINDIKSYMHLIPQNDQGFYNTLVNDPSLEEDIDGYNVAELDFDLEHD